MKEKEKEATVRYSKDDHGFFIRVMRNRRKAKVRCNEDDHDHFFRQERARGKATVRYSQDDRDFSFLFLLSSILLNDKGLIKIGVINMLEEKEWGGVNYAIRVRVVCVVKNAGPSSSRYVARAPGRTHH